MNHPLRHALCCAALLAFAASPARAAGPERLTFEQHVRPILKAYCLDCHGAGARPRGKLDLRLRRFLAKGGISGPAIVPGHAGKSRLVEKLKSGDMPPTEKKV